MPAPILTAAPAVRCSACPIRTRAVCAYCTGDELKTLDGARSYKLHRAGAAILRAGERPAYVGSIVSGAVKLSKTLPDGRRQIVGLQFQSDFLGGAMSAAAAYDAEACGDVLICQFERPAFEKLLSSTPHLDSRLREMALNELDAAREWLLLLGRKSAREKIASFLSTFARRVDVAPQEAMALPLLRSEIADYLGLTIETVSRQMSKLKAEGIIAFQDAASFSILDPDALAAATGDEM